jgi:hypothetical protein
MLRRKVNPVLLAAAFADNKMEFTPDEVLSIVDIFTYDEKEKEKTMAFRYPYDEKYYVDVEIKANSEFAEKNPTVLIAFKFPRSTGGPPGTPDIVVTSSMANSYELTSFFFNAENPGLIIPQRDLGTYGFTSVVGVLRALQKQQPFKGPFTLWLLDDWATRRGVSQSDVDGLNAKVHAMSEDDKFAHAAFQFLTGFDMQAFFKRGETQSMMSAGLRWFCAIPDDVFAELASEKVSEDMFALLKLVEQYRKGDAAQAIAQVGYYGKYMFHLMDSTPHGLSRGFGHEGQSLDVSHADDIAPGGLITTAVARPDSGFQHSGDKGVPSPLTVSFDGDVSITAGESPERQPRTPGAGSPAGPQAVSTPEIASPLSSADGSPDQVATIKSILWILLTTKPASVQSFEVMVGGEAVTVTASAEGFYKPIRFAFGFHRVGTVKVQEVTLVVTKQSAIISSFFNNNVPGRDVSHFAVVAMQVIFILVEAASVQLGGRPSYNVEIRDMWHTRIAIDYSALGLMRLPRRSINSVLSPTNDQLESFFDVVDHKLHLNSKGLRHFVGMEKDDYNTIVANWVSGGLKDLKILLNMYRARQDSEAISKHGYYGQFRFTSDYFNKNNMVYTVEHGAPWPTFVTSPRKSGRMYDRSGEGAGPPILEDLEYD